MQRRPPSTGLAPVFASVLMLGACAGNKQANTSEPTETTTASDPAPTDTPNDGIVEGGTVGKELPPELVAELRLEGADANGRLLTLAPGFVATAECSDCGAPSYLWFLAVRCADTRHCEVLTEQCEGEISRDTDTFVVAFRPVEGGAAEVCAGYSGTFVLP
jgi:hypothetical protein